MNYNSINKIILIQFRTDQSRLDEQRSFLRYLLKYKDKLKIINAFSNSNYFLNPEKTIKKNDKIILGGSGEFSFSKHFISPYTNQFSNMIQRMSKLIKYILKNDIDTLGICFGHQLIAHFLGSKIIHDQNQEEVGSYKISLLKLGKHDQLFKSITKNFFVQEGHGDCVENKPSKSIILATGKRCKIQSFKYKKNIYAVQFHPELSIEDILKKLKLYDDYTKGKDTSLIIKKLKSTPYASRIISNFLNKFILK